MPTIKVFFKDFPYTLFSVKRKSLTQDPSKPRQLAYTCEVPGKFEHKFWEFDTLMIERAQYYHIHQQTKCRKAVGYIFYFLS